MADFLREYFGLTQERLASWLGISRVVQAQIEAGQRNMPLGRDQGTQDVRITMASMGKMLRVGAEIVPAPPSLPPPAVDTGALQLRLAACRLQAARRRNDLTKMKARATQLTNRLAALPALRGYLGPVKNPDFEAGWLSLFENEAVGGLRYECGPAPQALVVARIAALEYEAGLLEQELAKPQEQ